MHMSQLNLTGIVFANYSRKKVTLDVRTTNISNETSLPASSSHTSNGNTHDDSDGLDGSIHPSIFSLTNLSG